MKQYKILTVYKSKKKKKEIGGFLMKNKRWVKKTILLGLIAFLFVISACGASTENSNQAPKMDSNMEMDRSTSEQEMLNTVATSGDAGKANYTEAAQESYGMGEVPTDLPVNQMMIYRGNMYIEVNDMKEASDKLLQTVRNTQGYLVNSSMTEDDNRFYAHYEFRVPVQGFHPLFDQIENLSIGKIMNQNQNGMDVTEEYVDLESRLKAKKVYEQRLLDFLGKAEKTEDLLKISNDLNRVQEEIESMQGRIKYLSYHASNSTLDIDLVQYKDKVAPTATTWEKAVDGFKQSIQFIVDVFTSIFIWAISFAPILLLLFILLIIVWRVSKKKIGISRETRNDEENNQKEN